jgi:hypothetical protein
MFITRNSREKNGETHRKNIFDFKRLKTSKKKVFTVTIDSDGVSICVHYRRLKADRPIVPSASPVARHEENTEAGPGSYNPQENDIVAGADPGNTYIITIAVPRGAKDGIAGGLRQKAMSLLKHSKARYYRESRIIHARKKV